MASPRTFHLPAETEPHAGTIMAWPTERSVEDSDFKYPSGDIKVTRREVANVARTIAKYEPLHLFVRDGHRGDKTSAQSARKMIGDEPNIKIHSTPNVHSLWARDSGPVFVRSQSGPVDITWGDEDDPGIGLQKKNTRSELVGLLLSSNNWGRKDSPNNDAFLAATAAEALDKSFVLAPFIAEGGGLMWDGDGTMLVTESAILNPNRNPGIDKATIEQYFATYFGAKKTIWVPGMRGRDITDDHIDALARFAAPGVVLVSKPFYEDERDNYDALKSVLSVATDAKGRKIRTVDVPEPDPAKVLGKIYDPESGPSVAYVNFHLVNGAVIMAKFGDEAFDAAAAKIIGEQFPGRVVEQVYLHELPSQGGGIHCATQQIPA